MESQRNGILSQIALFIVFGGIVLFFPSSIFCSDSTPTELLAVAVTDDPTSTQDLSYKGDRDPDSERELVIRWNGTFSSLSDVKIFVQTNFEGDYELLAKLDGTEARELRWNDSNPLIAEKFQNGPQFYQFYQFMLTGNATVENQIVPVSQTNAAPVYFGVDVQPRTFSLSRIDQMRFLDGPKDFLSETSGQTYEKIYSRNRLYDQVGGIVKFFRYYKGYYYVVRGGALSIYDRKPASSAKPIYLQYFGREIADLKITDDFIYLTAKQYPRGGVSVLLTNRNRIQEILRFIHDYEPTAIEPFDHYLLVGGKGRFEIQWTAYESQQDWSYEGIIQAFDLNRVVPVQPVETKYLESAVRSIAKTGTPIWVGTEGNTYLMEWINDRNLEEIQTISIPGVDSVAAVQDAIYLGGQTAGPTLLSLARSASPDRVKSSTFPSIAAMAFDGSQLLLGINPVFSSIDPPTQAGAIDLDLNSPSFTSIAQLNGGEITDLSADPEGYCLGLGSKGIEFIPRNLPNQQIDLEQRFEPTGCASCIYESTDGELTCIEENLPVSDRPIQTPSSIYRLRVKEDRALEFQKPGLASNAGAYHKVVSLGGNGYLAAWESVDPHGYRGKEMTEKGYYLRIDHLDSSWNIKERFYLEAQSWGAFRWQNFDMDSERILFCGPVDTWPSSNVYLFSIEQNQGRVQLTPLVLSLPEDAWDLKFYNRQIITTHKYHSTVMTFWDVDWENKTFTVSKQNQLLGNHQELLLDGLDTFVLINRTPPYNHTIVDWYRLKEDGSLMQVGYSLWLDFMPNNFKVEKSRLIFTKNDQVWAVPKSGPITIWQTPGVPLQTHLISDSRLLAAVYPLGWMLLADAAPLSSGAIVRDSSAPAEQPAIWRRVAGVVNTNNPNQPQPITGDRIVWDSRNQLLILDSEKGSIQQLDRDSRLTVLFDSLADSSFDKSLNYPLNFCQDQNRLIAADTNHNQIRSFDLQTGELRILAGTGQSAFNGDGKPALQTNLDGPCAVCVLSDGTIAFGEGGGRRIRAILSDGTIRRIAGVGIEAEPKGEFKATFGAIVNSASVDIGVPMDLAAYQDKLYFTSLDRSLTGAIDLSKFNADGSYDLQVVLGGHYGDEGEWNEETPGRYLRFPEGLTITSDGRLFVCDSGNYRILESDLQGNVLRTYGGNGAGSSGNGLPAFAFHGRPVDVCVDSAGNIFFTDAENRTVRRITPEPVFTSDLTPAEITKVQLWRMYEP